MSMMRTLLHGPSSTKVSECADALNRVDSACCTNLQDWSFVVDGLNSKAAWWK